MRTRTLRTWVILAGLVAIVGAAVQPTAGVQAFAGVVCLGAVVILVWLDGLRRRTRR